MWPELTISSSNMQFCCRKSGWFAVIFLGQQLCNVGGHFTRQSSVSPSRQIRRPYALWFSTKVFVCIILWENHLLVSSIAPDCRPHGGTFFTWMKVHSICTESVFGIGGMACGFIKEKKCLHARNFSLKYRYGSIANLIIKVLWSPPAILLDTRVLDDTCFFWYRREPCSFFFIKCEKSLNWQQEFAHMNISSLTFLTQWMFAIRQPKAHQAIIGRWLAFIMCNPKKRSIVGWWPNYFALAIFHI